LNQKLERTKMCRPYWVITPEARKRIEESSLKKFTPEQRERLKEIAEQIQKELEIHPDK
jgi:hypothetical protein